MKFRCSVRCPRSLGAASLLVHKKIIRFLKKSFLFSYSFPVWLPCPRWAAEGAALAGNGRADSAANQKRRRRANRAKRFIQSFRVVPIKAGCLAYGFRELVEIGPMA